MVYDGSDPDQGGEVLAEVNSQGKRRVAYFYDENIVPFYYGRKHPMKPRRIGMTHELIMSYDLYKYMKVHRPTRASVSDMLAFHTADYIELLMNVSPATREYYGDALHLHGLNADSPPFEGVADFSRISAGGTLNCASLLNQKAVDIAINWAGGLHHAKKSEASGFCYVNDIVLGILELLKNHQRVLYVDVDCHHGDGVEEAFYVTNRVMTVSFHQYGDLFPYTGALTDRGEGDGINYAVNVPLDAGIDDESYRSLFEPIMSRVVERYQPEVVVLQCGADSLAGDRLGSLNLTTIGHGRCVEYMRKMNLPLLLLGGGGYTIANVARCWAYETSIAVGQTLSNDIPENTYYNQYGPYHQLHLQPLKVHNYNSVESLNKTRSEVLANLSQVGIAPSVQIHRLPDSLEAAWEEEVKEKDGDQEADHADERLPVFLADGLVEHPAELYSGETDNGGEVGSAPTLSEPEFKRKKDEEDDELK